MPSENLPEKQGTTDRLESPVASSRQPISDTLICVPYGAFVLTPQEKAPLDEVPMECKMVHAIQREGRWFRFAWSHRSRP